MPLRIPNKPYVPTEKQTRTLAAVAARWRVPSWLAEARLEEEGVPIISVPQPDTRGVRLLDLLALEEKLRTEKEPQATKALIKQAIPCQWTAAQIMADHRNEERTNRKPPGKRAATSEGKS